MRGKKKKTGVNKDYIVGAEKKAQILKAGLKKRRKKAKRSTGIRTSGCPVRVG